MLIGLLEGLARQFQPRDEMTFGFPADSVTGEGVLDEKTCQIAADPPPQFSLINNAGPPGGPIVGGVSRVTWGGAKPAGGPARYGPEHLGPLVLIKGAGMGTDVTQFGERATTAAGG
ncbi:hypothetical protein [Rhodococcus wratislaviensis]|uniref:Uncharacterized protein n=1 Tax=Rhodococcus wratislaviensis NBRC 100605 TaxID=1219028 RepID=X0QAG8_RHOWR|nr:hypothetical protein [Rhodococcus wratislaviensis]GAF48572.1 hypothetical protein RW1_055_00680 [Rhodococcus wratislaviensis NBRC 100605]